MASHITLLCVIGGRIWPGQCYLNGPSRHTHIMGVYVSFVLSLQNLQLLTFSKFSEMDFSAYILIS